MRRDSLVIERLHALTQAVGADFAWVVEIARAGDVPCHGRVWVAPTYHPRAKALQALDGRPLTRPDLLTDPRGALDDFAPNPEDGSGRTLTYLNCRGLRVQALVGLEVSAPVSPRKRKAAIRMASALVAELPPPPVRTSGELVLLYNPDRQLLYLGGDSSQVQEWAPAVERLGEVLESGGPAVLDGAAVHVRALDGPDGAAYLVNLRASTPVFLAPDVLLTPSQRQVAGFAADGATVKEIAAALGRHVETVRTHLREAYRRLDVGSRIELARALAGQLSPFPDS